MSRAFLRIMTGVIKALGETLTQLPMGPATPGMMAGPSFEIRGDIQLLPYKRSAWIYIHERLRESAARALELSRDARAPKRQAIRQFAPVRESDPHPNRRRIRQRPAGLRRLTPLSQRGKRS